MAWSSLLSIAAVLALLLELSHAPLPAEARTPPYFGPNDRAVRGPAQSRLRVDTIMDIFLLELLPFKASFVLKNVSPNCSKALSPLIDDCYKDYETDCRYSVQLKGSAQELQVGCCGLWKYHECVVDAVERLAHYSFRLCNELDAEAAEEVLEATESHPKSRLMCADYHRESFYCGALIESNFALNLVLILGLMAILVAAAMAGYMFYLSTVRVRIVYVQAALGAERHGDGVELIQRKA